jgi:hypothetical protein
VSYISDSKFALKGFLYGHTNVNRFSDHIESLNTDFEREWSYKHHLEISTELCYVEILDEITHPLGHAILEDLNNNLCDKREFIKVVNCCTMIMAIAVVL